MNRRSSFLSSSRWASSRKTVAFLLLVCLALVGAEWAELNAAHAQQSATQTPGQGKAYWQNRYRTLLADQARLRKVVETETELYADANRRNYRRGPVRHEHRDKAFEAEAELRKVEAELAGFEDKARRSGALPGWLYEVEAEAAAAGGTPAAMDAEALEETEEDREGRNPLFLEKEDEES